METLFYVGIIFVLGTLSAWISPKLGLPRVVGYLLLGLIIGPEILGLIPSEFVRDTHILTDLALSVIAVLVGASIKPSNINGSAKEIINITIFQSVVTFVLVVTGFLLMKDFLEFSTHEIILLSLLLGGIATATAPATPLAIVHELRSKGKFTSTLLAIVAADDAVALIIFTLALTAGTTFSGSVSFDWINLLNAGFIVLFSAILGLISALIITGMEKIFTHQKGMETISTLGMIFIVYSLSEHWKLEPLLSSMIMGIVLANTSKGFDIVEEEIDAHLAEMIFMLFFIISAMYLKIDAIFSLPYVIELYVVLRLFGKIIGSYLGAVVSKSSSIVKKYMGIALVPQAGVAIGLALSIQSHEGLGSIAPIVLNIVIATTLIHELIGPFMTKYAIEKSGESFKKED